jgi:hypothetical protein
MTELVAMGVVFVERLEVKRKRLDRHAIYFIEPSKQNVDLLLKDFPGEPSQPQYRRIHILFTTFLEKGLLKSLALSKPLLTRIAKRSLKEFYFSAAPLAPNLVDLGLPYLSLAFSHDSNAEQVQRQLIANKLIEFVANFEDINTVRIFFKKSPNKVCERMANSLESTIKSYLSILLTNRSPHLTK